MSDGSVSGWEPQFDLLGHYGATPEEAFSDTSTAQQEICQASSTAEAVPVEALVQFGGKTADSRGTQGHGPFATETSNLTQDASQSSRKVGKQRRRRLETAERHKDFMMRKEHVTIIPSGTFCPTSKDWGVRSSRTGHRLPKRTPHFLDRLPHESLWYADACRTNAIDSTSRVELYVCGQTNCPIGPPPTPSKHASASKHTGCPRGQRPVLTASTCLGLTHLEKEVVHKFEGVEVVEPSSATYTKKPKHETNRGSRARKNARRLNWTNEAENKLAQVANATQRQMESSDLITSHQLAVGAETQSLEPSEIVCPLCEHLSVLERALEVRQRSGYEPHKLQSLLPGQAPHQATLKRYNLNQSEKLQCLVSTHPACPGLWTAAQFPVMTPEMARKISAQGERWFREHEGYSGTVTRGQIGQHWASQLHDYMLQESVARGEAERAGSRSDASGVMSPSSATRTTGD